MSIERRRKGLTPGRAPIGNTDGGGTSPGGGPVAIPDAPSHRRDSDSPIVVPPPNPDQLKAVTGPESAPEVLEGTVVPKRPGTNLPPQSIRDEAVTTLQHRLALPRRRNEP